MTRGKVALQAGRDRMLKILLRHFDHEISWERANNIAQAMVFDPPSAREVAIKMLRDVHCSNGPVGSALSLSNLASQIAVAWHGDELPSCRLNLLADLPLRPMSRSLTDSSHLKSR